MKRLFKIAAYCCGGVMGAAAGAWNAGWCGGISFVMILIGCGCGLFVAMHELAVIRAFEEEEREAIMRSVRKAEFFREVNKL